ncbi:hypothetical protein JW898_01330 [Candidatus Woesearchaeota archaeon]|nr:hypothetical protein [Candidatus Woesearchaeota archaeon]
MGDDVSCWKGEWRHFLDSFSASADRRLLYVALLEVLLVALVFSGYYMLGLSLDRLSPQIAGITESLSAGIPSADLFLLQGSQEQMVLFYRAVMANVAVFAVFALLSFFSVKFLIYCVVSRVRPSLALWWRFLVAGVVWSFIFVAVVLAVQYLLGMMLFKVAVTNLLSQLFVVMVTAFVLLSLFYLTVAIFTPLTLLCSIKGAVRSFCGEGLRRLFRALPAVLFGLLMFALLNLVMLVLVGLPAAVFVVFTTLLLLAYFVWLRFYNTAVWRRIMDGRVAAHAGAADAHGARAHAHHAAAEAVVKRMRAPGRAGAAKKK